MHRRQESVGRGSAQDRENSEETAKPAKGFETTASHLELSVFTLIGGKGGKKAVETGLR